MTGIHATPLTGPGFGSYPPSEVTWLLSDLSHVDLEAPTEEREEAIQCGGAHYAESLPIEYQPSEQYQALYQSSLAASASRVAHAVGVVTQQALAARGAGLVLVSSARAGTPVGVLMRRYAKFRHGLDAPHYTMSIVRGRGIDTVALAWLAKRHDSARVMFVDGWTGKGAITRELAEAVTAANRDLGTNFNPQLAVLADTGHCTDLYGTREDFLIPSACLNSTVSGLVSRTVLSDELIKPGMFHGAKFYQHLAPADVSAVFIDTIAAHFADAGPAVDATLNELARTDRTPDWRGWAAVEKLATDYGINSVNLVKPGVGETTRVMLRRVPWKVLVATGAGADVAHIRMLAEQRRVPIEEVDALAYTAVGLIHPHFTSAATGEDGKAVRG